jgi:hypothetical protein
MVAGLFLLFGSVVGYCVVARHRTMPELKREDVWASGVWHALGEKMTFFSPCSLKSDTKLLFVKFSFIVNLILSLVSMHLLAQFLMTSSRKELTASCYRIY